MRKFFLAAILLVLLPMVGCASRVRSEAAVPAAPDDELSRYRKFAGEPVEDFSMFNLFRWQVVGPQNVVAWATIREAYLLKVDQPCIRLEYTNALGLTTMQKWKVSRTFDFVTFEEQRCKILEIRPIDLAAMAKSSAPAESAPKAAPKT